MHFVEIRPEDMTANPFELIGKQWGLIGAGNENACNCMTASWGQVGVLWNKPVFTLFVRPQRHTNPFLQESDLASFSFLPEEYRKAMVLCGRMSGREGDKFAAAGITPLFDRGVVYPAEAEMVFFGKKLWAHHMDPNNFIQTEEIESHYSNQDYHWVYVYELTSVLKKEK